MGLTTSYVWQGRRQSEVSAMIRHEARSVEEQQGVKRRHSNSLIDAARTGENRVLVNDGQGGFKLADSVDEISEAFERRLAQRKAGKGRSSPRKIRSDSNTAALFVLQLDPEFTGPCEGMAPEKRAEVERLHQVMIDQVVERMGQQNVISVSHHWDETHPHVHIICTAMTPDDRVAYYQAVGNDGKRSDWAAHHDAMRQALRDSGYDATFERVGQGRKGETLTMFKQQMDQQRAAADEIGSEWISLDERDKRFDGWRARVERRFQERDKRFEAWRGEVEREFQARDAGMKQEAEKWQKKWEALGGRERMIVEVEELVAQELEDARETKLQASEALAEATQMREAAEQAADTAVGEAVAAWERDELPRLRRKAVEDAEAKASSIKQDAEEQAKAAVEAAQKQVEAAVKAAQEQAAEIIADAKEQAEAKRQAAYDEGWKKGFSNAEAKVEEICNDFRVRLQKDVLQEEKQSVHEKVQRDQAARGGTLPEPPEQPKKKKPGGGGDYGDKG